MNKTGSILDLIFIALILLVFSIIILVVYNISDRINTEIQAHDDVTTEGKAAFNQINNMYSGVLDNSFLLLAIGLAIAALILASLVRIHPIFLVFYIIILIILIFVSGIFSNVYLNIAGDSEFSTLADQLTFTTRIMYILPWFVGIVGTILAIIMYKNWKDEY